jgi:molybdenum cofactor synthesis domain-containing protein
MLTRAIGILAIGTEITDGQIQNTHPKTLSERLKTEFQGLSIAAHLAVPDDRELIFKALDWMHLNCDGWIVTGGLGPTSDDFTRDVLANWSERKLTYHEESWRQIEERLKALGVQNVEANRQQCFYPEGSAIFHNTAGTANGFALEGKRNGKDYWMLVLPGPPRELDVVWRSNDVKAWLSARIPSSPLARQNLFTYQCIGVSEAALGEIVESALSGSTLARGYRAYLPFVEVKLWMPADVEASAADWASKAQLEKAIQPYLASTQGQDLAEKFWLRLQKEYSDLSEVFVIDRDVRGVLSERLLQGLRKCQWGQGDQWERKSAPPTLTSCVAPGKIDRSVRAPWIELRCLDGEALHRWSVKTSFGHSREFRLSFSVPRIEVVNSGGVTAEQRQFSMERAYRMAAEMALVL